MAKNPRLNNEKLTIIYNVWCLTVPCAIFFTRLWMNLKLAVRGKWEKNTNNLRSQKCKKQYIL